MKHIYLICATILLPVLLTANVKYEVSAKSSYSPEVQLREGDGSIGYTAFGVEVQASTRLESIGMVSVDLGYERSNYDFSRLGEPFGELDLLSIGVNWRRNFNDTWGGWARMGLEFAGESDADLFEGDSLALGFGPSYQLNEVLSIFGGIFVRTEYNDDTSAFPVIGVQWQPNENLTIRTYNGVYVEYTLHDDEKQSFDFSLSYWSNSFRLNEERTDGLAQGSLQKSAFTLTTGYRYAFNDYFSLRPYFQMHAACDFEFHNKREIFIDKLETNTAFAFGLQITGSF